MRLKGKDIIGRKVLILGETGSGKTRLAAKLLRELMVFINPKKITIIDLGPIRTGEIGGKIMDYLDLSNEIKYLSPKNVHTPRLSGNSPKQILHYAKMNEENMKELFKEFIMDPTEVLILNDVTLFLHSGKLETVLKCLQLANTVAATAYYGIKLARDLGTGLSLREKQLTDKLAIFMDSIVKID